MVLDYQDSILSQYGLKFRNRIDAPAEGAADAFGLSIAVIVPADASRILTGEKLGCEAITQPRKSCHRRQKCL